MDKISIVVPVYNVEKYIKKCLDSLVIQSYDNYDIYVVNDGSPFNEQTIIDEYVSKYPNLIKSIVKENGGYGSVLELAFNTSDSDFVLVCDPDDYLDKDCIKTLMTYQKEDDLDLVIGAKNLVYEDNDEIKYDPSFNEGFGKLVDKKVYKRGSKDFNVLYFMEPSPHAKLYRRDIVKNIKFPNRVSYTDSLLYFYALTKVNKVSYCKEPLSYYLINRCGNTRTDLKPTTIDMYVTVFNSIIDQTGDCDDIFYFRMFEAFYYIFYKVDNISGDISVKKEKYALLYSFLERLIPYKKEILSFNKKYMHDNFVITVQKNCLLADRTSKRMYTMLVEKRLSSRN